MESEIGTLASATWPKPPTKEQVRQFFANLEKSVLDHLDKGLPVFTAMKPTYHEVTIRGVSDHEYTGVKFTIALGEPAAHLLSKQAHEDLVRRSVPEASESYQAESSHEDAR